MLGSSTWRDKNWPLGQSIVGEDLSATQSWDSGSPPAVIPSLVILGDANCIAQGENPDEALNADELVDGFPVGCFVTPPLQPTGFEEASAVNSCSIQLAYARLISWLYDSNVVAISDFLTAFLGTHWPLTYHPATTLLPAVLTAVSTEGTLVWIDGTANWQQFALQSAYSVVGPQNFGAVSTSAFWYNASTYVMGLISTDGADPTKPIFLCGHSYGGVCACLAACRYKAADFTREIKYLTYGMPRLGNDQVQNILGSMQGICLANEGDLVPAIPPSLEVIYPVVVATGLFAFLVWPNWLPAPNQALLLANGQLVPNGVTIIDFATVSGLVADVLAGVPYPEIVPHSVDTYFERTYLRCPEAEWPLTPDLIAKLLAHQWILQEDGSPVLMEDGTVILLESAREP